MMAEKKIVEEGPVLIRVSEAARLLCVSTLSIYKMISSNRLDSYRVPGCTLKVDKRQIEEMLIAGYKPQANGRK